MHKKKTSFFKLFINSIFIIIIVFLVYYFYSYYAKIDISSNYQIERTDSTINSKIVDNYETNNNSISDILENVSQCIVGISKIKSHSNSIFSPNSVSELGLGTGIIVSSNGYILSNSHVTGEKNSTCYITLENGKTYEGIVVWSDFDLDLSITKINASNLTFVTIGDSSKVKAGQSVYAIGNPIGYEFRKTITSGIISATNRTIRIEENDEVYYMTDLLQTDASINPGNSGGPLILSSGEVIGINTIKITSAEGIGFAVPINVVKPIIDKFINQNSFDEAFLGIYAYDKQVIPYISSELNSSSGLYVVYIDEKSPALSSGIKTGDIITSIDNIKINTMLELKEYIYSKSPGDTISLNISRGYITKTFNITLTKNNI